MKKKKINYASAIVLTASYPEGYDSEARGDLEDLETEIKRFINEKISAYNQANKQIKYHEDIEFSVEIE